ncbi:YihY/virulence factor BrkB family protein [Microbacterium sp. QXD-8]|uniref:YihY/virulence factor BrkB family protein n=1 Tax=Microbacterium psychrotolerans TaxID=3068321 RepID=A0ABU0Z281_9MICO|nr:YihY/virulence factor BrkB family protein [Microbacterium sp. QXD-8]MDQ7878692.1 YihY/virulence factor BrkB family protein [Microbacterium sp. QXD-8]
MSQRDDARRRDRARAKEHDEARDQADAAQREEESLRERWEATQENLRERFDQPLSRATALTQRTLAWFPVRVWRHFLQHNGFLLAAGVSYQALFATFAAIYVAFAITGLWLGGSADAVDGLINLINLYVPGLIADEGGLFTPDQVTEIATSNAGVLGITGIIALGTLIWTAIGFVTFARRAVRDIFGLPPDLRSYFYLKARDLVGAGLFALALVLGFAATSIGTWALSWVFDFFGWTNASSWVNATASAGTIVISFAIYSAALGGLIRFLTGTKLPWRRIWPGALLGGGAITVLQLFTGWLFIYTPTNALLATFAIFVGLLLWFRLIGIIMLVAAAWIAVAAKDEEIPLLPQTEAERLAAEHAALLVAARVRLRTAQESRDTAPWYRRWAADRALRDAEEELAQVEAAAPAAPAKKPGSLFE